MGLRQRRMIIPRVARPVLHAGRGVVDHCLAAAHLIRKIPGHRQLVPLGGERSHQQKEEHHGIELFHVKQLRTIIIPATILLAACSRQPPPVDPQLAAAIAGIKAIDNHAHPVLAAPGDREFDALPVDHMEPQSDAVALRPGAFQTPFTAESKAAAKRERGDGYPAWVLDQMGVETMLANRVAMGTSVGPPRFRWVPYADALIFPLDNAHLAAKNPDREAFFPLEDKMRARYLAEAGLGTMPATLADYLARVAGIVP